MLGKSDVDATYGNLPLQEGHRFEAVVLKVLNINRNSWKEEYVDLSSNSVQDSLEEKIAREQNCRYWTRCPLTFLLIHLRENNYMILCKERETDRQT